MNKTIRKNIIQKLLISILISILVLANMGVFSYARILNTNVNNLLTGITLESKYDIRNIMKPAAQKGTELCWAFAAKGAAESYLKTVKSMDYEFSAKHMDYVLSNYNYNTLVRDIGSQSYIPYGFNYYTKGIGPVIEEKFPFNTTLASSDKAVLKNNIEKIFVDDYKYFPSIIKTKKRSQDQIEYRLEFQDINSEMAARRITEDEVRQLRNAMKAHIKKYGALVAGIQVNPNYMVKDAKTEFLYTPIGTEGKINHAVNIVGWDNNFCDLNPEGSTAGAKPNSKGAWLVRDSNIPNGNQFYYVSFDDNFIETNVIGIEKMSMGKNYGIYSRDLAGANAAVHLEYNLNKKFTGPYNVTTTFDPDINNITGYTVANVFEKNMGKKETLEKISFMAQGPSVALITYLPKLSVETGEYNKGAVQLGKAYLGTEGTEYKTIELDKPFVLPDKDFAIAITIVTATPKSRPTNTGNPNTQTMFIPGELQTDEDAMFSKIPMYNKSYILASDMIFPAPIQSPTNLIIRAYVAGEDGEILPEIPDTPDPKPETPEEPGLPETPEEPNVPDKPEKPITPEEPVKPSGKKAVFEFGNGEIKEVNIGTDGYVMEIPTPPSIEGYKFMGWDPDPRVTKATSVNSFIGLWEKSNAEILNHNTTITPSKTNESTASPISMPAAGLKNLLIIIIPVFSTIAVVSYIKYKKLT